MKSSLILSFAATAMAAPYAHVRHIVRESPVPVAVDGVHIHPHVSGRAPVPTGIIGSGYALASDAKKLLSNYGLAPTGAPVAAKRQNGDGESPTFSVLSSVDGEALTSTVESFPTIAPSFPLNSTTVPSVPSPPGNTLASPAPTTTTPSFSSFPTMTPPASAFPTDLPSGETNEDPVVPLPSGQDTTVPVLEDVTGLLTTLQNVPRRASPADEAEKSKPEDEKPQLAKGGVLDWLNNLFGGH